MWFFAEKVMYQLEHFDPKIFLARIHKSTSSSDLVAGEGVLITDLQNCKDQLKKLVKENFDCFISCKNTIDGKRLFSTLVVYFSV